MAERPPSKVTTLPPPKTASVNYRAEVRHVAYELTQMGWSVTPLVFKSKAAVVKDWQKTIIGLDELDQYFPATSDCGIGLLLGTEVDDGIFGVAFDIDLDEPNLIENVQHAVGAGSVKKRGRKGVTLIARSDEALPKKVLKRKIDEVDHIAVERLGTRIQTVLPPSIHPDTGRPYEWDGKPLWDVPIRDLPVVDQWTWDEITLAVSKPESLFFHLNSMAWFGPGKGGTVDVTLLEASAVLVQRGWPDEKIVHRVDRAVRSLLDRTDGYTRTLWSDTEYRRRLKSMVDDARAKGFDKPAKSKQKNLARVMAEFMVDQCGGVDNLWLQPAGDVRVYKDGWWRYPDLSEVSRTLLDHFPADNTAIENGLRTFRRFAPSRHQRPARSICCLNGTVDLVDGELRGHARDDLLISFLPIDYDPKAHAALYESVIFDTFQVVDEEDTLRAIRTFEEFAGYTLVNSREFQKFLVIRGEPGSGKSTAASVFRLIHNFDDPSLRAMSTVMFDQIGDERSRTALAGNMVNVTGDLKYTDRVADGYVKAIVAGDPVPVRKLYCEPVDVEITARLVVLCNDMFKTNDTSGAMERRMLILRCDNVIAEKNQDKFLGQKLQKELPGILNRIIAATQRLYIRGRFEPPRYMQGELSQFSEDSNVVQKWYVERTHEGMKVADPDYRTPPAPARGTPGTPNEELYADFVEWSRLYGFKQMNVINWGTKLSKLRVLTSNITLPDGRQIKGRRLRLIDRGVGNNY